MNQHLQNRYSNYYVDTMPLFLGENDISFDLYNINFDKIAKLLADTPQAVLGITVQVNIAYEVRFKGIPSRDNIQVSITTTNDSEVLNNIQDKVENYFVNFLDTIFKAKNYRIISKQFYIKTDIVWPIISKELNDRNISFKHDIQFHLAQDFIAGINAYEKLYFNLNSSVLAWAGEGYDPQQLTWQNFLSFYKKSFINFKEIQVEDDYYVSGELKSFTPQNFMIENLLFKNNLSKINLKEKSYFTILKTQFDQQLEEFAKVTMDFWHYYQLETYNNGNLVFKIKQDLFNNLLSKSKYTFSFTSIFYNFIFDSYRSSLQNPTPWYIYQGIVNTNHNINWIKNQKSLIMEVKFNEKNDYNTLHFGYHGLGYSFLIYLGNLKNIIQKIEFKLI